MGHIFQPFRQCWRNSYSSRLSVAIVLAVKKTPEQVNAAVMKKIQSLLAFIITPLKKELHIEIPMTILSVASFNSIKSAARIAISICRACALE